MEYDDAITRTRVFNEHAIANAVAKGLGWSDKDLEAWVQKEREHYISQDKGYVVDVDYILCKIEGCPRTEIEGQIKGCGAKFKLGIDLPEDNQYCGACLTVQLWDSQGLFDEFKEN